jgi:isochorismate synthase
MMPHAHTVERKSPSAPEPPRLFTVTAPAPPAPLADVLRTAGMQPSLVWSPRLRGEDEWSFVGWGAAARADGAGEERFSEVRARAESIFDRLERAAAIPFTPRLFGGFAFAPGRIEAPLPPVSGAGPASGAGEIAAAWAPFGDASFALPRLLYAASRDRAVIAAFVPETEASAAERTIDALARELEAPRAASASMARPECTFGDSGKGSWCDLVTAARLQIQRRAFDKVVLSRTRRAAFTGDIDLARVFAVLDERQPETTRFFIGRDAAGFIGATPERLLSLRGRRLVTEALAGSIPRRSAGADAASAALLLASDKDRSEHAFVVSALREALGPLCEALLIPAAPEVRSLAHLHHLATPIAGTLRARAHVLDLARRLHPTPALCGAPRAQAAAFILANEPSPRGWYGGGVGWLDASGDGAIHVAIRSALLAPRTAWIYAGAGIVGASDPEAELEETIAKERAMRDALGAGASP